MKRAGWRSRRYRRSCAGPAGRSSPPRRSWRSPNDDPSYQSMTLAQRIDADLKDAMRAKDATKLGVLRMLKSALKYAAIAKSGAEAELNDAEAAQVIRKQAKQRQDSIESFEKGGRAELAEKEKEELSILNGYLPQPMSGDEISK